jgi:hypothetical protein
MGNAFSEPYERTEYQSGASRLLNSVFMAICIAPLMILGMCVMLGWNEQRAVCSQKAISSGKDAVQLVGCDNPMAGSGSLILFACDIDAANLPLLQFSNAGDFSGFQQKSVGIKVESYMYQCIEKDETHEQKTQGGGKKKTHHYTYRQDWRSGVVDSKEFGTHSRQAADAFQAGCKSRQNPQWNPKAPKTATRYASQMKVGAFTTSMTDRVPIDTPVQFSTPTGWQANGTGSFYFSGVLGGQPSYPQIGDVKVMLKTNNPNNLKATVLGANDVGTIGKWTAPSLWLCSGFTLSDLRMSAISRDDFFNQLASEATAMTWALRLIGFIVMWFAFCLCFGPLEVAGDCIPCVGPWIGDSIAAISCCVACLPATACTLGVAGIVWVAMRPLIGIPCMIAFVIIIGGFGAYIGKQKASKRGGQFATSTPSPNYGAVHVPAPAVAIAQPVTPQPRQMQVQAPLGCYPGMEVQFQTPDGTFVKAQVPEGIAPGGFFTASY